MSRSKVFDGERLLKAHSVRRVEPIFERLAVSLARLPELRYVKVFPERHAASTRLSGDGKKNPVVEVGAEGLTGVELLVDVETRIVQFYAITSAIEGGGRRMVESVLEATPEDWHLAVVLDWSGGFWRRMAQEYPRIQVL